MTVVAIDGPAGAGKSTVARSVADAVGFDHLDTGAMYRAVALAAIERGVDLGDGRALGDLARGISLVVRGAEVQLDDRDVSERIRAPDVTEAVSRVSAHPDVRSALVEQQRALGAGNDVVVEGRDIGSTVFPQADVKVYLTASLEERARRRCLDLGLPCDVATIERVKESIEERDRADAGRASSPLRRPADAVELDTTGMSEGEVVDAIVHLVRDRA